MKKASTKKTVHKFFALAAFLGITLTSYSQDTKEEFKPSGNFWGYSFGDYSYKLHGDSLGRGGGNVAYKGTSPTGANPDPNTNPNTNMFQIRRAYLGYDYNFSPKFSAYAVLAHEELGGTSGSNQDAGGNNSTYLKYVYLKWADIFPKSNLLIGQMPTLSFATGNNTEPLWGYRSVSRTIMDMHNIDASSDMGVSLQGALWSAKEGDKPMLLGYMVQVGNGNSAKPENDIFKKVRGNVYMKLLNQKLTLGLYGDYNIKQYQPYHQTTTTFKAYAHYRTDWFSIGAEVFQQTNGNGDIYQTTSTAKADTADGAQMGVSLFGSSRIIKDKLNFFANVAYYTPDSKFSSSNYKYLSTATGGNNSTTSFYTQTFLVAGFDYTPNPRIHIMPNIWYSQYNTIASATPAGVDYSARQKSDYDIVARISFYYIFNSSKKVSNNGMDY